MSKFLASDQKIYKKSTPSSELSKFWPMSPQKKPKKRRKNPERKIQVDLMKWANFHPILKNYQTGNILIHIPNGNSRNAISGFLSVQAGEKAGVPDLLLPLARSSYHGLWIELKSPSGVVSEKQKLWHVILRENGYAVCVPRSLESAQELIEKYLNLEESWITMLFKKLSIKEKIIAWLGEA